jgi:hypothetical protein
MAKFRAGVLYRLYEKTRDENALDACIQQYRQARAAWAQLAAVAKSVYLPDITVGEHPQLHGHWLDRLPAFDRDIAGLEAMLQREAAVPQPRVTSAIKLVLTRPSRPTINASHTPKRFAINLTLKYLADASVLLHYRHVNQAERYQTLPMDSRQGQYSATIPAEYANSPYPIAYYFEIKTAGNAWLWFRVNWHAVFRGANPKGLMRGSVLF